ncbi:hypothetical protein EON65_03100 [archaeon]|nr:MAG: hypothetical protein EON65_03100 [archaeon]
MSELRCYFFVTEDMSILSLPDLVWLEVFRDWLTLKGVCTIDTALSTKQYGREILSSFYASPFFQSLVTRDLSDFCQEVDHKILVFLDWLKLRNCRVNELGVTVDSYDLSETKVYPFVTRCNFTSFIHQQIGVESHMTEMFASFPNLTTIVLGLHVTLGLVRKLSLAPSSYSLKSIRFLQPLEDYHSESETTASLLQLLERYKNSIEYFETVDFWSAPLMQFIYSSCPRITYMHHSVNHTVTNTIFMGCLYAAAFRIEEINVTSMVTDMDIVHIAPELTSLKRIYLSGPDGSAFTYRSIVALCSHCQHIEFAMCAGIELAKWQYYKTGVIGFDLQLSSQSGLSSLSDVHVLFSVLPPLHTLTLSYCDEEIANGLCCSAATPSLQSLRALCISDQAVCFATELLSLLSECRLLELLSFDDVNHHHTKALTNDKWNRLMTAVFKHCKGISALQLRGLKRFKTDDFTKLIAEMPVLSRLKIDHMNLDMRMIDKYIKRHKLSCQVCSSGVPSLMIQKDYSLYNTFVYFDW